MVSNYPAPLRAVLAGVLLSATALAAAQTAPAAPSVHPANVADPQAATPAVRYRSALTYRVDPAPAVAPAPAAAHRHHDGMVMPTPMSMPKEDER